MNLFEQVDLIGKEFWSVHSKCDANDMIRKHTIIKTDNVWVYIDEGSKILLEDYNTFLNNPKAYYGNNKYIFDSEKAAIKYLLNMLDNDCHEMERHIEDIMEKKRDLDLKIKTVEQMLYDAF